MPAYLHDDAGNLDRFLGLPSSVVPGPDSLPIVERDLDGDFRRVLERLRRFYPIDKASLTFYDQARGRLCVTHIYEKGTLKGGIALNFPAAQSAMLQVLRQGFPVADNFPQQITSGVIEKRILLCNSARSVIIIPLASDGIAFGILTLASRQDGAFSIYLEGIGAGLVTEFAASVYQKLKESTSPAPA